MKETTSKKLALDNVEKNLERLYKATIEENAPLDFFRSLYAYAEYIFGTSPLKEMTEAQLAERNTRYEKIAELEATTIEEMRKAKSEILSVLEKSKLDVISFERHSTHALSPSNNIVMELEAYEIAVEKNEFSKNGYYSDTLQAYLYDISSNLWKNGYEEQLKKYFVTKKEYAPYYRRLTGMTSNYFFAGNENGSFIFSKTLPERFEQCSILKNERLLKPWAAFETLSQFRLAHEAIIENLDYYSAFVTGNKTTMPIFDADDRHEISLMTEDLRHIMGQTLSSSVRKFRMASLPEMDSLHVPVFKNVAKTVHNTLIQKLGSSESEQSKPSKQKSEKNQRIDIFVTDDFLCFGTEKIPIERGQKSMTQFFLDHAMIYRNAKIEETGTSVSISELIERGGYRDEDSFRSALKLLRSKLRKSSFPIEIENRTTGKYQLVVRYN